jgi:hypothetical protein
MPSESSPLKPLVPLVALVAWILPGGGYLLLGQRARGLIVGITIIALFILGLLIAGVRVLEVPGYDTSGERIDVTIGRDANQNTVKSWVMYASPLNEIRNKPWFVPQVLTGPITFAAAAWSVHAASPDPADPTQSRGALSHSRINEIGSLYLSVAGLLNLMAIIDSAHRAGKV